MLKFSSDAYGFYIMYVPCNNFEFSEFSCTLIRAVYDDFEIAISNVHSQPQKKTVMLKQINQKY